MSMQMSLQSAVAMVQQARMLCRAVQLGIQLSEDACNFIFYREITNTQNGISAHTGASSYLVLDSPRRVLDS